ncbi:porin [Paraburkholderia piptadeniae]|nr:porin [Paraburkholderia piptadeniae]
MNLAFNSVGSNVCRIFTRILALINGVYIDSGMKTIKIVFAIVTGAILGLAGDPSRAQSSVALYGALDVLIDISNQGRGTLTQMSNGGTFGSRFGIMGSEDIGNGYKSVFRLEGGFAPNTGTVQQGGAQFGRQAYIGFEGPNGALTFGRQYSPEFLAVSEYDVFQGGLGHLVIQKCRTRCAGSGW